MKLLAFPLALIGFAASLLFAILVGLICGVERIPGVVEPGYLHTDDKEEA